MTTSAMHARRLSDQLKKVLLVLLLLGCGKKVFAVTGLEGNIDLFGVTAIGSITVSSMTVSSITVTDSLRFTGTPPSAPKSVVQIVFSSTTQTVTKSTGVYDAVDDLQASIALSNSNNYVRISVTGVLSFAAGASSQSNLTVKRDGVDLGNPDGSGLAMAKSVPATLLAETWRPVGISITDSPGDISTHTYGVYIKAASNKIVGFPHSTGYLILEEIAQ